VSRARGILACCSVAALLAIAVLAAGASAATPRTTLPDVEDEVMCTICGTLLEESDSPQAESERNLIRKLINQGETKDQIKDALVAQYGPRVLATPSGHGFDLAAWIVPGLVILLVIIALGVGASRLVRRKRPPGPPAPLDPGDEARLDRDLSSYDL
jgi:cytochrome c-type biogenesis protein CcmH/NrfF